MLKHLHMALTAHNEPRYRVASKINRPATWLSAVVHEAVKAKAEEKTRIAKILGKPVDTLFPETIGVAS